MYVGRQVCMYVFLYVCMWFDVMWCIHACNQCMELMLVVNACNQCVITACNWCMQYVCMHACVSVCMYACICMYACVCVFLFLFAGWSKAKEQTVVFVHLCKDAVFTLKTTLKGNLFEALFCKVTWTFFWGAKNGLPRSLAEIQLKVEHWHAHTHIT